MPHKRAKRSIRLANSEARGTDNPPTAADSLLPITTTGRDGSVKEDTGEGAQKKKRRKGAAGGGQQDMGGVSKSAYRIINAVALREAHHAKKKRKLEDEEKSTNPNQKKKPALTPLPYESLSSFNRRVEQEMRSSVRSAIKDAGSTAQKKKDRKGKAKKTDDDDEEDEDEDAQPHKGGKPPSKKPKPTPEESLDPFAPAKLQRQQREDEAAATGAGRNRTGKTEFDTASQRRRIDDVVQAPPTLAQPARKGLLAKVLGPGGAASAGVSSEGTPAGGFRLSSAEAPVGSSRLPVNAAMKAMLDAERERAVKMYRELKEKKEKERSG
ncbi:hypothetical protein JCM10207_008409 [Rhodosporidiobolus poonsookiae]